MAEDVNNTHGIPPHLSYRFRAALLLDAALIAMLIVPLLLPPPLPQLRLTMATALLALKAETIYALRLGVELSCGLDDLTVTATFC